MVVSVVHVLKGRARSPILDERQVSRISAYLVEGDMDGSPARLEANEGKAFQGSIVLGMGFTFDDFAAAKGEAENLDTMRSLIEKNAHNATRIFPYIGGEEVNSAPTHSHHRYAIDFADFPLRREPSFKSWFDWSEERQRRGLREGEVPIDYPDPVAEDWPDLLDIVRRLVKPVRDKDARKARRERWWRFGDRQPGLYRAIAPLERAIAVAQTSPHVSFSFLPTGMVYGHTLIVIVLDTMSSFSTLQSRPHEIWTRTFAASMKDDQRYLPPIVSRPSPSRPASRPIPRSKPPAAPTTTTAPGSWSPATRA